MLEKDNKTQTNSLKM